MEDFAKSLSITISLIAEIIAALIIGVALLQFLYGYGKTLLVLQQHYTHSKLRVKFGSSLTLALELLLAADILITAIAPSWEDIGKLASIAAIRTALNYFLEKELAAIEDREFQQKGVES